jgi:arylsulfatase A-like enzyme
VRLRSQNLRQNIYQGAIQGVRAWAVYALVECGFLSILPWIVQSHYDYIPLHWGFTILLSFLYLTSGLILGGMSGLCYGLAARRIPFLQKVQPIRFSQASGILILVFAFAINLIVQWFNEPTLHLLPPLFISLLLAIGLALSSISDIWFKRLLSLNNSWTISVLLLGLPWITHELLRNSTRVVQALSALGYVFVIFLISFGIQKIVQARQVSNSKVVLSSFQARSFLLPILALMFVLGISFFLRQEEPRMGVWASKLSTQDLSHPNVVLIQMDAVRADHLSLYGYGRNNTPKLKEFSQEASLFKNAIAPGDMTLSSVASIFTGMYPRAHGAHYNVPDYPFGRPLCDKFQTIAEILSKKGYFTMSVVANYAYISHHFGLDRGFQYHDQRAPVPFLGPVRFYSLRNLIRNILTRFASSSNYDQLYRRAEDINSEVFSLLQKVKENRSPFFLSVNYMDAHDPYIPPAPFDMIFPGKIKDYDLAKYRKMAEKVLKLERKVTAEEYLHLVSQYDGGIAYIDFHIGKLIARLKEFGLYENCLIIITSDHGEVFGERDLIGHGISVYQDQIHVPLIIKYPNNRQSIVVNETVSLCDLMPTILDFLGFKIPGKVDGESLLRLNHNNSRKVISESFPKGLMIDWHMRFKRIERAIFSGSIKFVSSTAGKREVYDLAKDPDEKENLYDGNGGISKELEMKLNGWLKDVKEESGSTIQLGKGTLDRLKSLGYIK